MHESAISCILIIQNDARNSALEVVSGELKRVLGKRLTPPVEALKEFLQKQELVNANLLNLKIEKGALLRFLFH